MAWKHVKKILNETMKLTGRTWYWSCSAIWTIVTWPTSIIAWIWIIAAFWAIPSGVTFRCWSGKTGSSTVIPWITVWAVTQLCSTRWRPVCTFWAFNRGSCTFQAIAASGAEPIQRILYVCFVRCPTWCCSRAIIACLTFSGWIYTSFQAVESFRTIGAIWCCFGTCLVIICASRAFYPYSVTSWTIIARAARNSAGHIIVWAIETSLTWRAIWLLRVWLIGTRFAS